MCIRDSYKTARKGLDDLATGEPGRTPIHPQFVAKVVDELAAGDAVFDNHSAPRGQAFPIEAVSYTHLSPGGTAETGENGFSRPSGTRYLSLNTTQDCVLGYFQVAPTGLELHRCV